MIRIIGLIIAVYAMVRVIQVPIEMTATQEEYLGLSFKIRLLILTVLSVISLLILGILTLILFLSDSPIPNPLSR